MQCQLQEPNTTDCRPAPRPPKGERAVLPRCGSLQPWTRDPERFKNIFVSLAESRGTTKEEAGAHRRTLRWRVTSLGRLDTTRLVRGVPNIRASRQQPRMRPMPSVRQASPATKELVTFHVTTARRVPEMTRGRRSRGERSWLRSLGPSGQRTSPSPEGDRCSTASVRWVQPSGMQTASASVAPKVSTQISRPRRFTGAAINLTGPIKDPEAGKIRGKGRRCSSCGTLARHCWIACRNVRTCCPNPRREERRRDEIAEQWRIYRGSLRSLSFGPPTKEGP